jgi:hypothetical protein
MITIFLPLIIIVLAVANLLSSHILKEPPIIQEVLASVDDTKCVTCSGQRKCLLKYHLIKGGKKMFDNIISVQPIMSAFSVLVIIASMVMVVPPLLSKDTENNILTPGLLVTFFIIELSLVIVPLFRYLYVRLYCSIFNNIGD